jgi:hypothetical protein
MNKAVIRGSERIYSFLLRFYPKNYRDEFGEEMKYVFSESLKDAYAEEGEQGLITLWARTIIDAGKSLVTQQVENQKGSDAMEQSFYLDCARDRANLAGTSVGDAVYR